MVGRVVLRKPGACLCGRGARLAMKWMIRCKSGITVNRL